MSDFYFTFGQKYRHELHPLMGHPDGWIRIQAQSEAHARRKMWHLCGGQWSTSYSKETFQPDWYPRGELAVYYDDIVEFKLPVERNQYDHV